MREKGGAPREWKWRGKSLHRSDEFNDTVSGVMMRLVNNWDLKDINNWSRYAEKHHSNDSPGEYVERLGSQAWGTPRP